MNLIEIIKELKGKRKRKETDDVRRDVSKIFEKNEKRFAAALAELRSESLADVIKTLLEKCYVELPTPDSLDIMVKYLRDNRPETAQKLWKNYWQAQEFLMRLKRTDITDDERLYYFLQVDKGYNNCIVAMAELNAAEKRKPIERPYDIA